MSDQPENDRGGGSIALDDSLSDSKNINLLRRAVRENWAVDAKIKADGVRYACDIAATSDDDRARIAAVKTLVEMDRVNQTDFWNADKNERIDNHKATEVIQYQAPTVNILPLPAAFQAKELPAPKDE